MTELLQRAITEIEKLSSDEQGAIAARILADLEDEQGWAARFAATTDEQWDAMVAEVRRDMAAGEITSDQPIRGWATEVTPGMAGSPPSRTKCSVGVGRLPAVPGATSVA